MTPYEIPLSPEAQKFRIKLGGNDLLLRVYWSIAGACWMLDIFDSTEAPIVEGITIVTGVDLLTQEKHQELGGALIAQTDYDPDAVPSFTNLGQTGRLYFVVV